MPFVRFFGKSTARCFVYDFILPLVCTKTYSNSKWNIASIPFYVKYEVHGALKEGHEAR